MILNLDTILATPFQVEIGGEIYTIDDPGMESIVKMISLSVKIKENPSIISELLSHMRTMTNSIPDKIFKNLSSAQVVLLMKSIGEHFLSGNKTESEDKQTGPLSGGA